jgi:hypothetical protein
MTFDAGGRSAPVPRGFGREADDLMLRIRGLVRLHRALQSRGAPEAELRDHAAEIRRLQEHLSEHVRAAIRDGGDAGAR